MVQVRYNTNYGVLPDQKRWRVLIGESQIFTNNVEIRTNSWTTKDIIKGDDGNPVEKFHITCKPEIIKTTEEGIELSDNDDIRIEDERSYDLIFIKWSQSSNKWKVNIKGEDRLFDKISLKTDIWTSDISPELCCRPRYIGISNENLYLSDII